MFNNRLVHVVTTLTIIWMKIALKKLFIRKMLLFLFFLPKTFHYYEKKKKIKTPLIKPMSISI